MSPKERILTIRILEKLQDFPHFANALCLERTKAGTEEITEEQKAR